MWTVELEDFTQALGLILDRRRHLVTFRHRSICRLHALLAEMSPGGAPTKLTAAKAAALLRSVRPVRPVETERREVAKQLLEDWRWCDRRIPAVETRLHDALQAHGTSLTQIFGIGDIGAATILSIVGDVSRFRSAGHFAAYNDTAPIEASSGDIRRHRLNLGGNRQLNSTMRFPQPCRGLPDPPRRPWQGLRFRWPEVGFDLGFRGRGSGCLALGVIALEVACATTPEARP